MAVVREAIRRAVDFFSNEVQVKSSEFLPYERQLVALAYVFTRRKSLASADLAVLRRWFWRTSFSERYRRGGEGLFDEDLATVLGAVDDPARLERFGAVPAAKDLVATEFRRNSALSNAYIALLASARPRNLLNGAAIDTGLALSSYNRKEFHHIFPQAYLQARGVKRSEINSLANICMLSAEQNKIIRDKRPSVYFADLMSRLGDDVDAVLESNLIPVEAKGCILADDYPGFLERRGGHLAQRIAASI